MSDVIDPNEPEGFEAAMRAAEARAAGQEPESQTEQEESTSEQEEASVEAEAAPEEVDENDPTFQKGYAKALGEQSEKLGQERAEREALERRLAQLEAELEEDEPPLPPGDVWEKLEPLYETRGGEGMMFYLANNEPELIDAGLALWKENDFRNAELYEKQMNRLVADMQSKEPGQPDPAVAGLVAENAQQKAMTNLARELGADKITALQEHLEPAFKEAPQRLQEVLAEDFQSGDAKRVEDAFRTLFTLAGARSNPEATKVAADQRAAASRAAKQSAQVATGSQRAVAPSGSVENLPKTQEEMEQLSPEDRRKAASIIQQRRILATAPSLAAGFESN